MRLKKNIALSESGFVFDPSTGDSYTLNDQAMEIVRLLSSGLDLESITDHILENYEWPGNVRELANAVERASILAGKQKIRLEHIPPALTVSDKACVFNHVTDGWPSLEELDQKYILSVLDHCEGKKIKAAQLLGIGANTLWRKLKKYQTD